MTLNAAPLGNAVQRLREGLARHRREPADEQVRDGLIQRFEFTYEISHRTLRRFLRQTAASPDEADRMSFAELVRAANADGLLLGDWSAWRRFRELRARSSRTDDTAAAAAVVAAIPEFLREAEHLHAELRRRLPREPVP